MNAVHSHHPVFIQDPVTGHIWEMCECGYCIDVTVVQGKA